MNIVATCKQFGKKTKKYSHLKCTFWIFFAAILSLVLSLMIQEPSWKSILQNVFAGFITGVSISLISSYKSKGLKDREIEQNFIENLRKQYLYASKAYKKYRTHIHDDVKTYYEVTYDLLDEMENVEFYLESADRDARLVNILGKKPTDFFNEGLGYNYAEQKKRQKDIFDFLNSNVLYDEKTRKTIDNNIQEIKKAHRALIREAINRGVTLYEEIIDIETSIP